MVWPNPCLLWVVLLAFPFPLFAQTPSKKESPKLDLATVETFLLEEAKRQELVGLSVAVVHNGQVVLAKTYGQTAVKDGSPITTDTRLAIGSITKQFTCACIFLLAEEGKLAVTDTVEKYYPNLLHAKEITLLDLMNNVSGYPDYYPLDFVDRRMLKPIATDDLLNIYCKQSLDFPPGTKNSYSNTGFLLLGAIAEKVSGQAIATLMKQRLFTPLEMKQTELISQPHGEGYAKGHSRFFLGPVETVPAEADGWIGAAGGIYSTPLDLAKWNLALMNGNVLKPESMRLMTTPRKLKDDKPTEYGCGLGIRKSKGLVVWEHGGAVSGFHATSWMVPSTKSSLILMSNDENSLLGKFRDKIISQLLGADAKEEPKVKKSSEPKKEESKIPTIHGPSAEAAAYHLYKTLQTGTVESEQLGEEFAWFLTPARKQIAKEQLKSYGEPTKIEVLGRGERGGMEVASIRFTCKKGKLLASMYRTPDAKIQQFLISKE